MKKTIEIKSLKKTYHNGHVALKGIDLTIKEGSFFALLGPNGAGKSTLINIMASLVVKSSGSISFFGESLNMASPNIKQQLGLMPQEINLGVFERVDEILLNQAGYYGIPRAEAEERMNMLLNELKLQDKKTQRVINLSGGMKRRVMVARAMMHDPKILILDEPTAGVDIEIRQNMWDFFRKLNQAGKTIILTTHYLEEAEHLCNDVGIINQGNLVTSSDMPSLLKKLEHEHFILYLEDPLKEAPITKNFDVIFIDSTTLDVAASQQYGISKILRDLSAQGIEIKSIRNKSNRLESLFLELTQEDTLK